MTTGNKVALGIGIALALAGVGVGLYFVFKKTKSEEQQAADILSKQEPPTTLSDLEEQNPNMSNSDLLKTLGDLLRGKKPKEELDKPTDEELYLQYQYPDLSAQELSDLGLS